MYKQIESSPLIELLENSEEKEKESIEYPWLRWRVRKERGAFQQSHRYAGEATVCLASCADEGPGLARVRLPAGRRVATLNSEQASKQARQTGKQRQNCWSASNGPGPSGPRQAQSTDDRHRECTQTRSFPLPPYFLP